MSHKRNIPNLIGVVHEICHETPVKVDWRQVCFLYGELLLLDWCNDGLGEGLCILLLYHGFDIFAVYLLGSRIVLFVLVKYYRIGWAFV